MALRNIRVDGDEILRKRAKEVPSVTDKVREKLFDMRETMLDSNGVGIAAPQVGIMRRMFIVEPEEGNPKYVINPKILKEEGSQQYQEGCLSVPGYLGYVERPMDIDVEYLNLEWEVIKESLSGFEATVFCHEYDHLEGVLFIDKAKDIVKVDVGEE